MKVAYLTKDRNYGQAKNIIPGGNMLLSKRPEMFYLENGQLISLKLTVVMFGT